MVRSIFDDVGDADVDAIGDLGDPGVARCGVQLLHQRRLLELPAERVLARTLTDDKNSHVPVIVAVARGRLVGWSVGRFKFYRLTD
jgi:hypothetical protein